MLNVKEYIIKLIAVTMCVILSIPMNLVEGSELFPELAENVESNDIGATMPYTRYETTAAIIGGGAEIVKSYDFNESNIASQASEQSYIRLPKEGSYAQWAMEATGNGITMRFTMPDTEDGMGQEGSLDIYVNNEKVTTVYLTSYYMWQYFETPNNANPTGSPLDIPTEGTTARFAFDEVHFKLNEALEIGDVIKVVSTGANNLEYGVDFLEIEQVPEKINKPDNAYSVTDFGADGTDEEDDYDAIKNCIDTANQDGKDVYIPEGTYRLYRRLSLNVSDIKITGAGMWYTNIQFTSSEIRGGGIVGNKASNVELCHMYINSNLRSRYVEKAAYKSISDNWCDNSYIHHIWEDHFECGIWLGDYLYEDDTIDYSDGIIIEDCRLRNNFADGVNFCQGTSKGTVRNCSIRNNGDDGLAMWNNNSTNSNIKDEKNNTFCYNTVELMWRASGIAVFGGDGHIIYNNYISDNFMSAGIRLNTTFAGHKFVNTNSIVFSNNTIVRCGSSAVSRNNPCGAVDISGNVKNITFENTNIYDAQHDGIEIADNAEGIVFKNTNIYGTGNDGNIFGENNGSAINSDKLAEGLNVKFDILKMANISYEGLLYGRDDSVTYNNVTNYGSNYSYNIPVGTSNIITKYNQIECTPEEIKYVYVPEAIFDFGEVEEYKYYFADIKNYTYDYKYMIITYVGDISNLRFQGVKNGKRVGEICWMDQKQLFHCSLVGNLPILSSEETTSIVINLKTSGINICDCDIIDIHYGPGKLNISEVLLSTTIDLKAIEDKETTTETPTTLEPTTVVPTTDGPSTEDFITEELTTTVPSMRITPPTRAKIKWATKKKNTKKVKLSIKKVKGANGYQVQFSSKKKFTKKNILVTRIVKKAKVTIRNKKLKKSKKLFVRVKAYKTNGSKKIWAKKWSKVKRVKVKK